MRPLSSLIFSLFVISVLVSGCSNFSSLKSSVSRTINPGEYERLKQRCDNGQGPSCRELGQIERSEDLRLSAYYYRKGCRHGDSISCDELLRLSFYTRNLEQDMAIFEQRCEQSHDYHCSLLSRYYQDQGKTSQAQKKLEHGCEGKDLSSCLGLMNIYIGSSHEQKYHESAQKACLIAYSLAEQNRSRTSDEQKDFDRENSLNACLVSGLRFYSLGDSEEAAFYYSRGCRMGSLSGRNLNENERLYQMLSCSRAVALSGKEYPSNWLDVSREYLKERCELQLSSHPQDDCYDLASLESLLENPKASIRYLNMALDLGYSSYDHMNSDPELEFVRSKGEFDELLRRRP